MVEYLCELEQRSKAGPRSICTDCTNTGCTNPIYDVSISVIGLPTEERLWSDSENPESIHDYCVVLKCEGHMERKD
jgi:hypothetical protein